MDAIVEGPNFEFSTETREVRKEKALCAFPEESCDAVSVSIQHFNDAGPSFSCADDSVNPRVNHVSLFFWLQVVCMKCA